MLPVSVYKSQKATTPPASMMERHFSVQELAEMWGLSADLIHDRFRDESGVIHTQRKGARGKRSYGLLRIPQSVAERVYTGMLVS